MGTGDLKNLATKLQSLLKSIKYPHEVNYSYIFYGYTQEYLPILHFVFQEFSLELVKSFLSKKYELSSKSDTEFVECIYKICRDEFSYVPKLRKDKFFSNGFTQQKLIFVNTCIFNVCNRVSTITKKKKKRLIPKQNKENTQPQVRIVDIPSKEAPRQMIRRGGDDITGSPSSRKGVHHVQPQTPIRIPPVPQELPDIDADFGDHSVILTEAKLSDKNYHGNQEVKIYSEEGARDIFAMDHHLNNSDSQSEVLDYEPHTTITDVEVIPIPLDDSVGVSVCKESSHAPPPPPSPRMRMFEQSSHHDKCQCGSEIAEIKHMLLTLSARMDIMESQIQVISGSTWNTGDIPARTIPKLGLNLPLEIQNNKTPEKSKTPEVTRRTPHSILKKKKVRLPEEYTENHNSKASYKSYQTPRDDVTTFIAMAEQKLLLTRTFLQKLNT